MPALISKLQVLSLYPKSIEKDTENLLGYFKKHLFVHYLSFRDDIDMPCTFLNDVF